MGKRVRIVLAAAALALVGLIVWQLLKPSEPVYKGKALSAWVALYNLPYHADSKRDGSVQKNPEARDAITQIGTKAIPTLLRMLRAKDSTLKTNIMGLLARQHIIKVSARPAYFWNNAASVAFSILGTNAQSAVPQLLEIANQNISRRSQHAAISSLGYIGSPARPAVPFLLQMITNGDTTVSQTARNALLRIDSEVAAKAGIKPPPRPPIAAGTQRPPALGRIGAPEAAPQRLRGTDWNGSDATFEVRTNTVYLEIQEAANNDDLDKIANLVPKIEALSPRDPIAYIQILRTTERWLEAKSTKDSIPRVTH
jgi:HEAT repeat protein